MNRWLRLAFAPFLLVSAAYCQEVPRCAALAKLALPDTKIVRAEQVAAGQFTPPGDAPSPGDAQIYEKLPAFCRVVAQAAPTTDSDIQIEVWMPASGWNGKFRGQGNGGFAGEIGYSQLALSVSQGYATAGTDTGHTGHSTEASWALHHPEKIADFGYRGIHEMTGQAKAIIDAYYGKPPSRSYFASCSDGGREALMEAQRFPNDYDGILAGAPAYVWTNLLTSGMHKTQALFQDQASYIPPAKLPAISSAVLAACDASDGVKDGILNDPRTCHFEPQALLCKGADSDSCLTQPQVTALKALYAATVDSTGKQVYPRSLPGGELGPGGWATWVLGNESGKSLGVAYGVGYFANMVYSDPHWDHKTFTVDSGLKAAVEKTAAALNATDPNLKPFASHGGKLILYHGWNDPAISPLSTLEYYQQVTETNSDAESFVRLFLVPGMQHCYGGPGPSSFGQFGWRPGTGPDDSQHDLYRALERWVDQGLAPETVIAAKIESGGKSAPRLTMTRPLCAYPKEAVYKGAGDTSDAANFTCK
jgi:Tannase and feruloyl esterase